VKLNEPRRKKPGSEPGQRTKLTERVYHKTGGKTMTRPQKATADYFPHSVTCGKTMFTLENKFGNDGYAAWYKILELLTSAENHFYDCRNPDNWEFLLAKTRLSVEKVTNILNLLARLGSINKELWQVQVIRSDNLIRNLSPLYRRRKINVISNSELIALLSTETRDTRLDAIKNPHSIVKKSIVVVDAEANTTTQNEPLNSEKKSNTSEQITGFLKLFGSSRATETEKAFILKAIAAGCTPKHLEILLQKKPDITSINAEWVLRELTAVKRCNDNTDTNLDEQIAEIKRQYGNFA